MTRDYSDDSTTSDKAPSDTPLSLGELVDLEFLLDEDAKHPRDERDKEDSRVRKLVSRSGSLAPKARLRIWIENAYAQVTRWGDNVESAYRVVSSVLFVLAFVLGWGAASALLAYSGDHPVNVLLLLGTLVGVQVGLVLLTVIAAIMLRVHPRFFDAIPFFAFGKGVFRWVVGRIWAKSSNVESAQSARRAIAFIQRKHTIYAAIERGLIFSRLQIAAFLFATATLCSLVVTVATRDIAFAWGTTFELSAEALHGLTTALSKPWAWLFSDAVPSLDLVRSTQYSRLESAFHGAEAGSRGGHLAGAWWSFVALALFYYVIVPRFFLVLAASLNLRQAFTEVNLKTPAIFAVLRRLREEKRIIDPADTRPLGQDSAPVRRPEVATRAEASESDDELIAMLIATWRDAAVNESSLGTALAEQFLGTTDNPLGQLGGYDYAKDEAFFQRLGTLDSEMPLILIAEPWTPPDRSFKRLLKTLRDEGGSTRHINVWLTDGGSEEDQAIWEGYLAELSDPFLALESHDRAPGSEVPVAIKPEMEQKSPEETEAIEVADD